MGKYVTQVYQAFLALVPLLEYATAKTFAQGVGARVLDLHIILRENLVQLLVDVADAHRFTPLVGENVALLVIPAHLYKFAAYMGQGLFDRRVDASKWNGLCCCLYPCFIAGTISD